MMKPNYDAMSNAELRAYCLEHREEISALEAFFARRSPDSEAVWQQEEAFRVEIEKRSRKSN
jgi:hypothetical protein